MKQIGTICLLLSIGLTLLGCQGQPHKEASPAGSAANLTTAQLKQYISQRRYQQLIQLVENTEDKQNLGPETFFYLAKAYRLRARKGDDLLAARSYHRTISSAPDFALAYRDLGILQMKGNRRKSSLENLSTYLELKPNATDRRQIEQYIKLVSRR